MIITYLDHLDITQQFNGSFCESDLNHVCLVVGWYHKYAKEVECGNNSRVL